MVDFPVSSASADGRFTAKELSDLTASPVDVMELDSIVQQQFAKDADVNTIVRRFGMTGELPQWQRQGMYGDFSGITDYESAVEKIGKVRDRFMLLPADVRERFKNDPGELVKFASDLSPEELAAALAPKPVEVVNAPPAV